MNPRTRGEAGEVGVDERLRRLLRHADVFRQGERGLPVEQRVVDDLRAAPQLVLVEAAVCAEHLQRRLIVDVVAARERLDAGVSSPDRCASTRSSICE